MGRKNVFTISEN